MQFFPVFVRGLDDRGGDDVAVRDKPAGASLPGQAGVVGATEHLPVIGVLEIEDDGIGFSGPASGAPGGHVGLKSLQERAKRLGGQLRIESEPGEGTRARVLLPFDGPPEETA